MKEFSLPIPRETKAFIGHKNLIDSLKQSYAQNRFSHAFLFTGPQGVGKATIAYHLIHRLMLSQMEALGSPIEDLTAIHRQLWAGNHPDCLIIERTVDDAGKLPKEISMEKIRSVPHFFSKTSLASHWRIALIDSIDDLSIKATNTLLKILEEPPPKSLLILLSHNLESVLPTLRSRVQVLPFSPLKREDTIEIFENLGISSSQAKFLSQVSFGRPGLGIMIHKLGGKEFYQAFLKLLQQIGRHDFSPLFSFADTYILKSSSVAPEVAWTSFFELLYNWLASALSAVERQEPGWGIEGEIEIAQNFFKSRPSFKWATSWSQAQKLGRLSHTFNLDKRQTLLCIFQELAGLTQR